MPNQLTILSETAIKGLMAEESRKETGETQISFELNKKDPSYDELVVQIFEAESVQVW